MNKKYALIAMIGGALIAAIRQGRGTEAIEVKTQVKEKEYIVTVSDGISGRKGKSVTYDENGHVVILGFKTDKEALYFVMKMLSEFEKKHRDEEMRKTINE